MSVRILLAPGPDLPSTQPSDAEIAATATALTAWITTDLGPAYAEGWNGHYSVVALARGVPVPPPDPRTWICHLTAASTVQNALGYHTRDVNGNPELFVAVQASVQAGRSWSLVASHEIAEALVNRFVDAGILASYGPGQGFYYMEACDPVEGQPGYFSHHAGVDYAMSNFVLPAYWHTNLPGPYDRGGYITLPLHPAPGGVQTVFVVSGAAQIGADGATVAGTAADPMIHAGNRI
jgi:hypothetical protein